MLCCFRYLQGYLALWVPKESTAFALETNYSPFCTILKECFQKRSLKYDTDKILPAQKLVDLTITLITIQCAFVGPLDSPTWHDVRFTRFFQLWIL